MTTYRIGRSDENDIVVSDTTVSRRHAELETKKGGAYLLRDLDSTYGTKILRDGDWLDVIEVEVSADTEITLGEYRTTVEALVSQAATAADPATEPAPAAAAQAPAAVAPAATPANAASGGNNRTTTFILIGGAALLLLVVVALVVALIDSGPSSVATAVDRTPRRTSTPGQTDTPRAPTGGTRARLVGEISSMCRARGNNSERQCRCVATLLSSNLTDDELRVFVELMKAQGDRERRRQLAQQFGATVMLSLGQKMLKTSPKLADECGVSMRPRR